MLFWGDLIHVADVQMPDPAVTIAFDADPTQAAITRKRTFKGLAVAALAHPFKDKTEAAAYFQRSQMSFSG